MLAGEASAAVDDAIGDALGEAAQATEQAAPADATSTDAPSAATPVETVPPSETAPVQAPAEPDTTPVSSDTAAGIATTATTAAPAAATAVQASPTNVNVSVRIGSPGDNGPVTQVNVAAAVTSAASATGAGASSAPIATTAAPSTTSGAHASTPASQPAAASSSTAQDDPETWTWQWNCLSKPDLSVISPVGSTTGSLPKNWTWIWNCGENPAQYQDGTAAQYQPSNVNIAIRISSPGNDGPVSQTNVAVAAHVGPLVVATPAGTAVVVPVPVPIGDVASDAVIPGMTSLPALVAPPEPVWLGGDMSVRSIVQMVDEAVDLPYVLPPLLGTGAFRLVERQRLLPGLRGARRPRDRAPRTGRRVRARNAFRCRRRGSLGGRALDSLGRLARRAPRRSARRVGARRFPGRCRRRSRPARASLPRPAGARPAAAYPSSSLFRSWPRCSIWPGASRSIACRCLRVIAAACPKTPASAPPVPIRPGAPAPGRCALRKEQRSHETHHDTPRCAPARPVLRRGTGGGGRRRWRCADRGPVRHERAVGRRRERRLPGRAVQQRVVDSRAQPRQRRGRVAVEHDDRGRPCGKRQHDEPEHEPVAGWRLRLRPDPDRRTGGAEHAGRERGRTCGAARAQERRPVDPRAEPRQRRRCDPVELGDRRRGRPERQRDGSDDRPDAERWGIRVRPDPDRRPGGFERPERRRSCGGVPGRAVQLGVVDPGAQPGQRR